MGLLHRSPWHRSDGTMEEWVILTFGKERGVIDRNGCLNDRLDEWRMWWRTISTD
jgi:hypothetical protein